MVIILLVCLLNLLKCEFPEIFLACPVPCRAPGIEELVRICKLLTRETFEWKGKVLIIIGDCRRKLGLPLENGDMNMCWTRKQALFQQFSFFVACLTLLFPVSLLLRPCLAHRWCTIKICWLDEGLRENKYVAVIQVLVQNTSPAFFSLFHPICSHNSFS